MKPVGRRGKFYQFTAIDDCMRLRILKIYPRNNQKTAIQFLDYVLPQLPFAVETIQTDNGAEFQSGFHRHVLDKGINHVYIKPRTPRLNGKVERSHRIDAEEFYRLLDGVVIDDVNIFNAKLKEWQDYYNYRLMVVEASFRGSSYPVKGCQEAGAAGSTTICCPVWVDSPMVWSLRSLPSAA
ncbi:DDE-type integrase/transposase/recombinase [Nocardia sp. NPDC051911]|uniref:integrase core domain-containing protein n=1 Tax=Nocardia sp. NPDC051911 TaxID=3154648 RepID=UPI003433E603